MRVIVCYMAEVDQNMITTGIFYLSELSELSVQKIIPPRGAENAELLRKY